MKNLYLTMLLLVFISCEQKEDEKGYAFNKDEFNYRSSSTHNSFNITYKVITDGLKETKLFYSKDSSEVAIFASSVTRIDPIFDINNSSYSCEIKNLESYTKYWFKIYFKDVKGNFIYSNIYSFETKGFNLRLVFPLYKKSFRGQPMYIVGEHIDTIKANYRILVSDQICNLEDIIMYMGDTTYEYQTKIPAALNIGKNKIYMYYKDKLVFTDELDLVKGGLAELGSSTKLYGAPNSFSYNGEIYLYYTPSGYKNFWKWNPKTNIWTQLSAPNLIPHLPEYSQGYELNGKIYFPPFTCTTFGGLHCSYQTDEKFIYSYSPDQNLWEEHALNNNEKKPHYAGLYSSFVHNNKLFCFVMHQEENTNYSLCALKMFDPIDYSWQTVIDSVPIPNLLGLESAVLVNKIYVLASLLRKYDNASTYYRNELYSFDLEAKTFIKKSGWGNIPDGTLCPYFFGYNGFLYYYGGEISTGYYQIINSTLLEYEPTADKWNNLDDAYSRSRYMGFLHNIDNRIYLGFGHGNLYYEFMIQ